MLPVNVQPCKVPPSQCLQCNLLNQAGSGPGALEKHGRRQGGDYNAVDAFFFFYTNEIRGCGLILSPTKI